MKTAVATVLDGKKRMSNRRLQVIADHYRVEPTACSPATGWEKRQGEHQAQTIRERQPRRRFASLEGSFMIVVARSLRPKHMDGVHDADEEMLRTWLTI
jgi:hypothetical protein